MLPIGLILGYLALCCFSQIPDYRYATPVMIALPFVFAVVPGRLAIGRSADYRLLVSGLLAGVLISIPMLARPDLTYVRYAGAILVWIRLLAPV
jgi:hypothetical protein